MGSHSFFEVLAGDGDDVAPRGAETGLRLASRPRRVALRGDNSSDSPNDALAQEEEQKRQGRHGQQEPSSSARPAELAAGINRGSHRKRCYGGADHFRAQSGPVKMQRSSQLVQADTWTKLIGPHMGARFPTMDNSHTRGFFEFPIAGPLVC